MPKKTNETVSKSVKATRNNTCTWSQQEAMGDWWSTSCGNEFTINDDTPKKNGMRFCLFCGGRLYQSVLAT